MRLLPILLVSGCIAGAAETSAPIIAPHAVRAVSFNIANGAGYVTAADRAKQNAFLATLNADVIGMQEVELGVARSGGGNTALQSTATMGGSVVFAKCASVDAQGRLSTGGTGAVGNALWVRPGLNIVDYWTVGLDYADQAQGGDGWPRCALVAVIAGDVFEFSVAVSHFVTGDTAYVRERRRLETQEATAYGVNALLIDANALGDEISEYVSSRLNLCSNPEFPGCVDQAWAQGSCTGRLVPTHGTSDHAYAAIADIAIQ